MTYQHSPESSSTKASPAKAYVRPIPHSEEDLTEALGHIGVIDTPHWNSALQRPPGFVSVRFVINGKPRMFKAWGINFLTVDKAEVPADVLNALEAANL